MLTSPLLLCQTSTLSPAPFAAVVVCPRPGLGKVAPVMFYRESHHHPIPDFPLKVWPWHPGREANPAPRRPDNAALSPGRPAELQKSSLFQDVI